MTFLLQHKCCTYKTKNVGVQLSLILRNNKLIEKRSYVSIYRSNQSMSIDRLHRINKFLSEISH